MFVLVPACWWLAMTIMCVVPVLDPPVAADEHDTKHNPVNRTQL